MGIMEDTDIVDWESSGKMKHHIVRRKCIGSVAVQREAEKEGVEKSTERERERAGRPGNVRWSSIIFICPGWLHSLQIHQHTGLTGTMEAIESPPPSIQWLCYLWRGGMRFISDVTTSLTPSDRTEQATKSALYSHGVGVCVFVCLCAACVRVHANSRSLSIK